MGDLLVKDSTASSTGVIITTYRRAGEIARGSFAFEDPTDEEATAPG